MRRGSGHAVVVLQLQRLLGEMVAAILTTAYLLRPAVLTMAIRTCSARRSLRRSTSSRELCSSICIAATLRTSRRASISASISTRHPAALLTMEPAATCAPVPAAAARAHGGCAKKGCCCSSSSMRLQIELQSCRDEVVRLSDLLADQALQLQHGHGAAAAAAHARHSEQQELRSGLAAAHALAAEYAAHAARAGEALRRLLVRAGLRQTAWEAAVRAEPCDGGGGGSGGGKGEFDFAAGAPPMCTYMVRTYICPLINTPPPQRG